METVKKQFKIAFDGGAKSTHSIEFEDLENGGIKCFVRDSAIEAEEVFIVPTDFKKFSTAYLRQAAYEVIRQCFINFKMAKKCFTDLEKCTI